MASKIYTAKELREAADNFWVGGIICEVKGEDGRVVKHIKHDAIIAMLRQSADMMEREEKRKKTVEYRIQYRFKPKGMWHSDDTIYDDYDEAVGVMTSEKSACDSIDGAARYWRIVSREVGVWKEVTE